MEVRQHKQRGYDAFKALLYKNKELSLILIDIDNFSNINDYYGIAYGDLAFIKIEEMLKQFNFPGMQVYKLESDQFSLVGTNDMEIETLTDIADTVIAYCNESTIELDDKVDVNVSLSIGIAIGSGIAVLNNAKLAINELREHTRGTYKLYNAHSPYIQEIQENIYWVNRIQTSVSDDNIVAFFQPIVNNKTGQIEKYECLARILDKGKYVSPFKFMDAAKKTRVISFITKSMIKQSCKVFRDNNYDFSINITNDDLHMEYLEGFLLRQTEAYGINPNRIALELLENIPSLEKGTIIKQLISLREKGFKISIDDFGSASSNFSRLLEFTPDYIKIDGAFIKNILTNEKSSVITAGIVSIAHNLGMKIIAEYTHSEEVQAKVNELGIDFSQGYFYGEPKRKLIEVNS